MPRSNYVSIAVIRRLPRYYRYLGELLEKGVTRISSKELADQMNLTASQIRQDLNCFGGFGQQGYGYNVALLHREISKILGLGNGFRAILIGAGNLGRAFAKHIDFGSAGFSLIGIFDNSPAVVGTNISELTVRSVDDLEKFCTENHIDVAVLCIPKEVTAELVDRLIASGVSGFWNFSHYDIAGDHPNVAVENAHLIDGLMTLCYQVNDCKNE